MANKFRCYDCENYECDEISQDQLATCKNALYCWKSTTLKEDGKQRHNRGCFTRDMAKHFTCKSRGDSQYRIECCQAELCNGGPFPALLPFVPGKGIHADISKAAVFVSVAMSVVVVFLLVLAIIMLCSACGNEPIEESESNDEASQPAVSRNVPDIIPLDLINVTPASNNEGAMAHESQDSLTDTTNQNDAHQI